MARPSILSKTSLSGSKANSRSVKSTKPANTNLQSLIERKAYELFESRGYSHGNDQLDWFEAEKLVKKSLNSR